MSVLLVSGLSVRRLNSFSTQLSLLAHGLSDRGIDCVVAGKRPEAGPREAARAETEWPEGVPVHDLPDLGSNTLATLWSRRTVRAAIYLGYVDQFPILQSQRLIPDEPARLLWTQLSRPPRIRPIETVIVPLTDATRNHTQSMHVAPYSIPHAVDTDLFRPPGSDGRDVRSAGQDVRSAGQDVRSAGQDVRSAENDVMDNNGSSETVIDPNAVHVNARANARRQLGLPVPGFVVGYVAVNQYRKRYDRLSEAFKHIRTSVPQAHLLIKTDRIRGDFDLGRLFAGANATIYSGSRSDTDMARMYRCMDMYLHVSEWEGFGIPVIEACSSGVAVATHAGQGPGEISPFPEFIYHSTSQLDGETELRLADPVSAAEAVLRYWHMSQSDRAAMSVRARDSACDRFSLNRVTAQWLELIESLEEERRNP